MKNADELFECLQSRSYVRVVTGHSHKMWNASHGNVKEHNSGSVCGAWWWTGRYNPSINIGQDGSPAGYRIMKWTKTKEQSFYKATGRSDDYQFRSYDRNAIHIVPSDYGVSKYADAFNSHLSKCGGFNNASYDNTVLVNVWDYDTGWKVEACEDGINYRQCEQSSGYDPLYIIAYSAQRFTSTNSLTFGPASTGHLFSYKASMPNSTVYIRVTDDEGREYKETMLRPKAFNINQYK